MCFGTNGLEEDDDDEEDDEDVRAVERRTKSLAINSKVKRAARLGTVPQAFCNAGCT